MSELGKRIVIAGAGGFGRGVYSWISQSAHYLKKHRISELVFIDDDETNELAQAPIISTIQRYYPSQNDEVLVAVGVPSIRRAIVDTLEKKGCLFHSFVDDDARIGDGVSIGKGTIICPGAVISAHANIGDHVHINFNSSVGHDTILGNFTTLSPMVNVMGETILGDDVFIGGSATILPRLNVGNATTIGAGAVVVNSITKYQTVVGNPAKPIKVQH